MDFTCIARRTLTFGKHTKEGVAPYPLPLAIKINMFWIWRANGADLANISLAVEKY